jgi:catechol 2,3-dioxygenase-like lactoylglutathione lyase family enzyme
MTTPSVGISLVSLIVDDYDEAIRFFVDKLGFELVTDEPSVTTHGNRPKRWVVVRPPNATSTAPGTGILLAKADGELQQAAAGAQWAGRVGLFWQAEDFDHTYARMQTSGVEFIGTVRDEPYGRVVVFKDIAGNKWDLLGPRPGHGP